MLRSHCRLIGYLLPVGLVAILLPITVTAQKVTQTAIYSPPTLSLTSDTGVVSACAGSVAQVHLNARASSPSGSQIRYHWSSSAGRISGNGADVIWDLAGLAPGAYKAFLEIETGAAGDECNAFTATTVIVKPCPPVRPVCPNVEIICPTDIAIDQPLTFSANVSGGVPPTAPIYNWNVSAGTIIEGQGTSTIKVDTTGLAGQTVKATLSMGGYTLDCSASCAVTIPLPQIKPRKFDEFPNIARNDEKARLDVYAVELQNDPTASAYVIVYPGRSSRPADVQRHRNRILDYLVNSRGIDARRITTLVGHTKDDLMVELWVVPQGAVPPTP